MHLLYVFYIVQYLYSIASVIHFHNEIYKYTTDPSLTP